MTPRSKTRVVHYCYYGEFDETEAERILNKAVVDGVVTLFDAGRGSLVWFEGHPGEGLRGVRRAIRALIPGGGIPGNQHWKRCA